MGGADRFEPVIRALRTAATQLDDDGEGWMANYVREAADAMARLGVALPENESARLLADLRRVARRNSGFGLGSALAAGLGLGRHIRGRGTEDGDRPASPGRVDDAIPGSGLSREDARATIRRGD